MSETVPNHSGGQQGLYAISPKFLVCLLTQFSMVRGTGVSGAVTFGDAYGFVGLRYWAGTGLSRMMKFLVLEQGADRQQRPEKGPKSESA
jgi:hypothetical protein